MAGLDPTICRGTGATVDHTLPGKMAGLSLARTAGRRGRYVKLSKGWYYLP